MVTIKRPEEVARMRHAGAILVDVLGVLAAELRPGASTIQLDEIAERMIRDAGAIPSFLGYGGSRGTIPFPGSICVSINDEVVHGIPSGERRIRVGDVVSLDIGCIWQGWHADTARTFAIGQPSERVALLIDATRRGMEAGIAAAVPGSRLGDVGAAIEAVAHEHGYGIVRPFVGHGIGTAMHEDPQVPNYGKPKRGVRLVPGLTIAIEPMVNVGSPGTRTMPDRWTVVSVDGTRSAHFEHTIAITENGPRVLTALPG
jgi:methionyl aminopeptidase